MPKKTAAPSRLRRFSRSRPTRAGRYIWRLPESEKSGYYEVDVVVERRAGGLFVRTNEGDDICFVMQSRGGAWRKVAAVRSPVQSAGRN